MNTKDEELSEREVYKEKIVEMLDGIGSADFMVFVYKFVKRLKENWGV